jgi:hypothetical protein
MLHEIAERLASAEHLAAAGSPYAPSGADVARVTTK